MYVKQPYFTGHGNAPPPPDGGARSAPPADKPVEQPVEDDKK